MASFVSTHGLTRGIGETGTLENMLKVNLPDGNVLEYSRRVRPIDIAADIGPRLAKATLAAEVDGRIARRRRASARRRRNLAAADHQAGTPRRWMSCGIRPPT